MISLAITGEQTAVHLGKDPIGVVFEIFQCLGIEDLAPVLGDADQVDGKPGNTMSLATTFLHSFGRPIRLIR
jgi:hypothetical protein